MTDDTTVTPDSSIVLRMRQGDPHAVRELRRRHSGSIYALAYMLVGDPERAEAVEDQTFRRAQRTAAWFDPTQLTAFSWLARIARSQATAAHALHEGRGRAQSV